MDEKEITLITSYLDKVGEKIGTGAETVWPWLIKQVYVDAFIQAIILIIIFYFSYIGFQKTRQGLKSLFEKRKNEDGYLLIEPEHFKGQLVAFAISCFFITSLILIVLSCSFRKIFYVFNPEYWALMDLINKI